MIQKANLFYSYIIKKYATKKNIPATNKLINSTFLNHIKYLKNK